MTKDFLRLAAYLPAPGATLKADYCALTFPRRWREGLLELWLLGLKRAADRDSRTMFPVSRLNTLIRAFSPGGVSVSKWTDVEDDSPWIYAPTPIPAERFAAIFHTWVRSLRPEPEHGPAVQALLESLDVVNLKWKPTTVNLLEQKITAGGTAAPLNPVYQLLPDALAHMVLEHNATTPYDTGTDLLSFRSIARTPYDRGAELMSTPRPFVDDDGQTWWFSTVIGLQVHTAPFDDRLRVHVRTGVRRWVTGSRLRIPYGHAASVYLLADAPWFAADAQEPASPAYAVARLRYDRKRARHVWDSGATAEELGRLRSRMQRPLPDPEELATAPGKWLEGWEHGVHAAVVHSTQMGSHGVGVGFMPRDRDPLTEWVAQGFPAALERHADLRRTRHSIVPLNPPFKAKGTTQEERAKSRKAERQRIVVSRRTRLGTRLGDAPLHLELLWQSDRMRDHAIDALGAVLGLDGPGGDGAQRVWVTPELTIVLHLTALGELGARAHTGPLANNLDINTSSAYDRQAVAKAFTARRNEVCRALARSHSGAPTGPPTLAVVEIARRDTFFPRVADPKYAIRLGARDANRVTQFLTTRLSKPETTKQAAERCAAAWLDGLRQLGLRVVPEHSLTPSLPTRLQYVGIWAIYRTAAGPTRTTGLTMVAVRVRPGEENGEPDAGIAGWNPDTGTWIPYGEYLIKLGAHAQLPEPTPAEAADTNAPGADEVDLPNTDVPASGVFAEHRAMVAAFFQDVVYSVRDRPTLVLTDAHNIRRYLPGLANSELKPDTIQIGDVRPQRITAHGANLRLVRVRTSAGGETPQSWAPALTEHEIPGHGANLWVDPDRPNPRIFYSTGDKPDTARNASIEASMFVPRPLTKGKNKGQMTIDTDIAAHNPSLLEIAVVACHSSEVLAAAGRADEEADDPEVWAALTHQLRRAADYRSAILLPLPLHLAKQAGEYVLPNTRPSDEDAQTTTPQFTDPYTPIDDDGSPDDTYQVD